MLFTIQLIIILICLFYGARKGGIALGLLGGIGLVILVFVFHLQPGKPPAAPQPEICLNCRAVCDLYTDHSLRYGSCGLHHSADHLRRRH